MYGIAIQDLWLPDGGPSHLTWRKLFRLIERLPLSSRTRTLLMGANADDRWTPTDYILASLHDWSVLKADILVRVNSDKGGGLNPKPKPFPRPSDALHTKQAQERKEREDEDLRERKARVRETLRRMGQGELQDSGFETEYGTNIQEALK